MPIVIARTGELEPVTTGLQPGNNRKAWACIIRAWADKHTDLLQDPAGAPAPQTPAGKTDKEA